MSAMSSRTFYSARVFKNQTSANLRRLAASDMPRRSGSGDDVLVNLTNRDTAAPKLACPEKARGGKFFDGMVFAFAGRFSAAQGALKSLVENGGGTCAASVTLKVTHVITTKAAVEAAKRSTSIATAIGRGLPLLHEDYLTRCVEEGELLNLQEFSLGVALVDTAAEEKRASEEEEKEQRRLKAAEIKMHVRVQRRLLLSAFRDLEDWVLNRREAQQKLMGVARDDRLAMGLDAFSALVLLKEGQEKDAKLDALQASMAALQMQQKKHEQDSELQKRKEEEKLRDSLEHRAISSLMPPGDTRLRLVLDTNIYLSTKDAERTWDAFERDHRDTAKILVPQVVLEEIDRKRHHPDAGHPLPLSAYVFSVSL
jgi:hypothetical protein